MPACLPLPRGQEVSRRCGETADLVLIRLSVWTEGKRDHSWAGDRQREPSPSLVPWILQPSCSDRLRIAMMTPALAVGGRRAAQQRGELAHGSRAAAHGSVQGLQKDSRAWG